MRCVYNVLYFDEDGETVVYEDWLSTREEADEAARFLREHADVNAWVEEIPCLD